MQGDTEALWREEEQALRAATAGDPVPLDEEIVEVAVCLRVLGLPTLFSCRGHLPKESTGGGFSGPSVAMRCRLASRFEPLGVSEMPLLWLWPELADRRERHYPAALAWNAHRPLALRLRALIAAFAQEQPDLAQRLRVKASWRGVVFGCRERERFADAIQEGDLETAATPLSAMQEAMYGFGAYLRAELRAGRFGRSWRRSALNFFLPSQVASCRRRARSLAKSLSQPFDK